MSVSTLAGTTWVFNSSLPNVNSRALSSSYNLTFQFGGISFDGNPITCSTIYISGGGPSYEPYYYMSVEGYCSGLQGSYSTITPSEYGDNAYYL